MSILRRLPDLSTIRSRIHTASKLLYYFPKDEKDGQPPVYDRPPDIDTENISTFEQVKLGYKYLKEELSLFKKEIKEKFAVNHGVKTFEENVVDVVWSFNGDPNSLDKWVVTADSDHHQGFSQAKLDLTRDGKALFHGTLDFRVPKDGKQKYAGYCNIKTVPIRKSFKRETHLDWSDYTHLAMRVRGDGRTYMINIGSKGQFNTTWFDLYTYVLYTRGGPYWQYIKIPFSKFVETNSGRVKDQQNPLNLQKVSHFGITASDRIPGPFKLEIDYIGLMHDLFAFEECAYESYEIKGVMF